MQTFYIDHLKNNILTGSPIPQDHTFIAGFLDETKESFQLRELCKDNKEYADLRNRFIDKLSVYEQSITIDAATILFRIFVQNVLQQVKKINEIENTSFLNLITERNH